MKPVFSEYIRIQLDKNLVRDLRNANIRKLLESQDLSGIGVEELDEFVNELEKRQLGLNFPFFEKVFFHRLEQGFHAGELTTIKLLLKCMQLVYQAEIKRKTFLYSEFIVIEKGLSVSPKDSELLAAKERSMASYLSFTIHEVPSGVLYGMNGASKTECLELLEMLEEYKQLCGTIQVDRADLIEECQFHYQHYYAYLNNRQEYQSYQEYLTRNSS